MGEHTEGKSESLSLVESVLFFFFAALKIVSIKECYCYFQES